jgi:hypothetical protein
MDIEPIRAARNQIPFESFVLRLTDGRSLTIESGESMAIGKRRIVVVGSDDSVSFIDRRSIASLEFGPRG